MNNRYLYNLCKKKMNTECEESQKALLNSLFITRRYFNEIIIVMFILHHLAKNQTNLIELYCIVSYPSHFLYFIFDMESIMMRIRLPYKYCDTYKFCYEWDRPPPPEGEKSCEQWNEHIELSETKQKVECIQLDQIYIFRLRNTKEFLNMRKKIKYYIPPKN